jgi:hypothetical protein
MVMKNRGKRRKNFGAGREKQRNHKSRRIALEARQ